MTPENQKIETEQLIIIGSGPAGLTSAIYAARANMKPLMIEGEEAGGQLMITTDVENYPGFDHGITGPNLIQVMRKQAERFGTRFITRNVTQVDFSQKPFKVWVGKTVYQAQTIIVSTVWLVFFLSCLAGERARMRRFRSVSRPGPERFDRPS